VLIGADEPAYPGIAFYVADVLNFELAYTVPHVSGQWDALQYNCVELFSLSRSQLLPLDHSPVGQTRTVVRFERANGAI
jgi:hypothetical protein